MRITRKAHYAHGHGIKQPGKAKMSCRLCDHTGTLYKSSYYYPTGLIVARTLFKLPKTVRADPEPCSDFRETAVHASPTRPVLQITPYPCSTVTSDCGFPIANSITKVRSLFHRTMASHIRLLDNDHLTLSHVRKAGLSKELLQPCAGVEL